MVLRLADTPAADMVSVDAASLQTTGCDDLVTRRARAIVQHERVMQEAQAIERQAQQARARAASVPVFGTASRVPDSARSRVVWAPEGQRAS